MSNSRLPTEIKVSKDTSSHVLGFFSFNFQVWLHVFKLLMDINFKRTGPQSLIVNTLQCCWLNIAFCPPTFPPYERIMLPCFLDVQSGRVRSGKCIQPGHESLPGWSLTASRWFTNPVLLPCDWESTCQGELPSEVTVKSTVFLPSHIRMKKSLLL